MAGNGGEIYKCVFRSGITRGRKKGEWRFLRFDFEEIRKLAKVIVLYRLMVHDLRIVRGGYEHEDDIS